jgi:hypothetical protein
VTVDANQSTIDDADTCAAPGVCAAASRRRIAACMPDSFSSVS